MGDDVSLDSTASAEALTASFCCSAVFVSVVVVMMTDVAMNEDVGEDANFSFARLQNSN